MDVVRSGPGILDAGWGGKYLPGDGSGSDELLRWLEDTQESNKRAGALPCQAPCRPRRIPGHPALNRH